MRRLPLRTHRFAGGLLAAVIAAGYIPAGTSEAAAAPPPRFSVDWVACPEAPTIQCGKMQVPVDWSKPHGAQITLTAARRPADTPSRRIGTLFYNPGGPGDGAAKYIVAPT